MIFLSGVMCTIKGVYKCELHPNQTIIMEVGDIFPFCNFNHSTLWVLLNIPL